MPKTRRKVSVETQGYQYYTYNGSQTNYSYTALDLEQICRTSGNYRWQDPPAFDNVGSNFSTWKREGVITPTTTLDIIDSDFSTRPSIGGFGYRGKLTARYPSLQTAESSFELDPGRWGPALWDRMKPTKPEFEVLNALYELREFPRMVQQRFSHDLKGVSNFWVALQFGWKPLLGDVKKLIELQRTMSKRVEQLLRDNGRPIRRTSVLSEDRVVLAPSSSSTYSAFFPILRTQAYATVPQQLTTGWDSHKIWGSARYRYWLPKISDKSHLRQRLMRELYGLSPRPSVIYNAIPWSWLIDWFSNMGDIIANLDAGVADRLAADYFYVMQTQERFRMNEASGRFYLSSPYKATSPVYNSTASYHAYRKARVRGSPFHPALKEGNLSSMQLSILGALGYSRLT